MTTMSIQDAGRVASWDELSTHLTNAWSARIASDRAYVSTDGHTIEIAPLEMFGTPWIEVLGRLGSLRFVSPRYILGRNLQVPIGAVALSDGEYVVRQRLPLDHMRVEDFDSVVRDIARQCRESAKEHEGEVTP
jgi:hypothetical protein